MVRDTVRHTWSYGEHRIGSEFPQTVAFGLQAIIKEHLTNEVVIQKDLDELLELALPHFGTQKTINKKGWQTLIDEFGGKLPLEIHAVPEGTLVPVGNVLYSITDTDPEGRFQWLGQYFEGVIMKTWMTSSVATRAYNIVKMIKPYIERTSGDPHFHNFVLHDFSYRSGTCEEHSYMAGGAVLLSTRGTDTLQAIKWLKDMYGGDYNTIGHSVPASEHRVSMHYGKGIGELNYLNHMLDTYQEGIVSIVSDTYDISNFISNVVPQVADKILERWKKGTGPITRAVFRPDSPRFAGDVPANQVLWIMETLAATFGSFTNAKGFNQLHPAVGVIYGDGLSVPQIEEIYKVLEDNKWDVTSVVVGQGGGLIQRDLNRDTTRSAIKPSSEFEYGTWNALVKDPLDKSKSSKFGRLKLVEEMDTTGNKKLITLNEYHPLYYDMKDQMILKLLDGKLKNEETLDQIRTRLWTP